ncbi:lipocalin family protein [Chryseobacterium sp. L7]|uniref:Lipocalin family protein n=1 Tax=Chryseobacterium endalhagicum TaxID=2797638 RepID=A0ABS1QL78_9FLAO|nr:lipocalin family protein [Chryseobacterium endalhagicum]MBL1222643.1 lipocalin family protein [Chryseobacterium endalhagicum]
MKKQLLLFAFSALALTSCKDDNIEAYELEMMSGDWKISKREIISGKDNKTVLYTETISDCESKNILHFRTDYYTSYTYFTEVGLECQMGGKNEGQYTYSEESKLLNIKNTNDTERRYRVEVLTSKDMKLAQLFGAIDFNNDETDDLYYITYKR